MLTIPEEVMLVETRMFDSRIALRKYDSASGVRHASTTGGARAERA